MRLQVLLLIIGLKYGQSANILGLFPLPGKSHYVMFESVLMRLAELGHNVDIATQFLSEKVPPRYNQISLIGSLPIFVNNMSINVFNGLSHREMVHLMSTLGGINMCNAVLATDIMKNLKHTQKKYDLIVTELFGSDCMLGFGHLFQIPTVVMTSSVALPWANDRFGNPDNPSYIPNYFVPFTAHMSLYERIKNTIMVLSSKYYYQKYSIKPTNEIIKNFFGPEVPNVEDLIRNTSLFLVNSHFTISHSRPLVPNFIEVGGVHIKKPKPLPEYFENLLKTDTKGIIFLTMGSMIITETFPPNKLQGMFDAFALLPYKVIWKGTRNKFPQRLQIPNNIHFESWLPQMDILCHPNVKLFVSHGGLMGSQEATYCGVPRLGIPLFADQINNVKAAENLGIVVKVDYDNINNETIYAAAKKLLDDSSFKENAIIISKRFKDRPLSALDTAIYWIEYVIRHKGAPHLRSAGADLYWYQYYLLDIGAIFIFITICTIFVLHLVVQLVLQFVSNDNKKKVE